MNARRRIGIAMGLLAIGIAHPAQATDISGTIASTLTLSEDSQLVGDVTCTVTGAPCIAFGASGLTLKLNGFTMTGLANLQTPCATNGPGEIGIDINTLNDETILGPGIVQGFRQPRHSSAIGDRRHDHARHGEQQLRVGDFPDGCVLRETMSTRTFRSVTEVQPRPVAAYDWPVAAATTGSVGTGRAGTDSQPRAATLASG